MNTVETIKHIFLDTGSAWILWLLGALSVACVAITIERWLRYRREDAALHPLAEALHARLAAEDVAGAITEFGASSSLAARVAAAGLRLAERGPEAVDKAMISRVALEREELE
ncbi:MAG: MotA/TolQ/ExbB proton channel family protein, partial [Myxococcales bacterium]|nr:MotA/TolQ/ExbB proton channel family protein [Myxococcales bacterium]